MQMKKGVLRDAKRNPIVIDQDQVEGLKTSLSSLDERISAHEYSYANYSSGQTFKPTKDFVLFFQGDVSSSDTVIMKAFEDSEVSICSFSSSLQTRFMVRGTVVSSSILILEYFEVGGSNCNLSKPSYHIMDYGTLSFTFTSGNMYLKF